jgi:hypothetical protein
LGAFLERQLATNQLFRLVAAVQAEERCHLQVAAFDQWLVKLGQLQGLIQSMLADRSAFSHPTKNLLVAINLQKNGPVPGS